MFGGRPPVESLSEPNWFPIFGRMAGRQFHPRRLGWGVWSNPSPYPGIEEPAHFIKIFAPELREAQVDLRRFSRNGKWQDIFLFGELVPIKIGWYRGGKHKGYTTGRDGQLRWGRYVAPAGYYGLWT
jgi:hypothetical protein